MTFLEYIINRPAYAYVVFFSIIIWILKKIREKNNKK